MSERGRPDGGLAVSERFRLPAEWCHHAATWLGWPHNRRDWPGKLGAVQWVYGEIVRHIAREERIRLIVPNEAQARKARSVLRRVGVELARIDLLCWPTNRGWLRDTGPIFVTRSDAREIRRFAFNAWARYSDWQLDSDLPQRAAQWLDLPAAPACHAGQSVVLEGGAIEVNGQGTLVTTEECLLDPRIQVRNPGLGREDYETVFREHLGADNVIWLARGIAGDDTHGHVDDLCRFVDERTLVLCCETDKTDANYRPLQENRERLQGARLEDGTRPQVVELPMPSPLTFDGVRLPASYANFYICNAAVLVPTFNDPRDRAALGLLSELFRNRKVVGIHAVDLVWGFGTLHCLTQQEPSARAPRVAAC
jgi:agmatine deiminase